MSRERFIEIRSLMYLSETIMLYCPLAKMKSAQFSLVTTSDSSLSGEEEDGSMVESSHLSPLSWPRSSPLTAMKPYHCRRPPCFFPSKNQFHATNNKYVVLPSPDLSTVWLLSKYIFFSNCSHQYGESNLLCAWSGKKKSNLIGLVLCSLLLFSKHFCAFPNQLQCCFLY